LEPIKKVARMRTKKLENVLTFFTHRITHAALEGLNSRIAGLIENVACGHRNRERFKTDILLHLGDLDLYPAK
jgi:transposase